MEQLIYNFVVSVLADVACHIICKWMDGDNKNK